MNENSLENLIPTVPFSVELDTPSLINLGAVLVVTATLIFVMWFAIKNKLG